MATLAGIGSSQVSDSFRAGVEAATQALQPLGSRQPDLVLLFASVRFDQESLLKGVTSMTGRAPLVGCSTAGEITSHGPSRRSVVIMAIASDSLRIATGLGRGISHKPREAGRQAAAEASRARLPNPHAFLMFPDGISGNVAEAIRGVQDVLGLSFPIVGGSAADDFGFNWTSQYFEGRAYTDSVAGVLLTGPIALGIGARHGWQPLGKPRRVTRARANVVEELDGTSAVNLYETYFETAAASMKAESLAGVSILYPLGMPIPGEEEYLLRNVLRVDPGGSLIYAGEIPEGSEVRLMMGSKAKAMEAARRAAEQAMVGIAPRPAQFGLVFSSCSRYRLFGREAGRELELIRQALGPAVPLIGFYDYGEQAPLTAAGFRGRSHFHNETVVVVAVSTEGAG
ncbi:MAG: FIST C-terminal domain-containing protein [Candidatus Omnitrophica bacterium]|nr:FIST C-terminal domain-containing protein [Candidatus Omnitrophota bacterium]